MSRISIIVLTVCAFCFFQPVWAASDRAANLRSLNTLSEFSPPEDFLNGNFVADEIEPRYVFEKVKDFQKSRSCPTNWLIEEAERNRINNQKNRSGPIEYTLYLEEDCPHEVKYYVFINRSRAKSDQWMEWRKLFHRSKAEEEYSAAGVLLEQASQKGFPVNAELRFIEIGGDLISKKPEDFLTGTLKIKPVYDFKQAKRGSEH